MFILFISIIIYKNTKNKKFNTTIIARNKNSLITLDNEIIKISDILDIKKVV